MKRKFVSPIASAILLPGTGQLLNRQPLKALALIGCVTVLFLAILFKFLSDLNKALQTLTAEGLDGPTYKDLTRIMGEGDHTLLAVLILVFVGVWAFSVVDAYIYGKRLDVKENETTAV